MTPDADEDTLSGDTTVQEKNITYPTDTKLHKKSSPNVWA
jgi:transposase, IS5 family